MRQVREHMPRSAREARSSPSASRVPVSALGERMKPARGEGTWSFSRAVQEGRGRVIAHGATGNMWHGK